MWCGKRIATSAALPNDRLVAAWRRWPSTNDRLVAPGLSTGHHERSARCPRAVDGPPRTIGSLLQACRRATTNDRLVAPGLSTGHHERSARCSRPVDGLRRTIGSLLQACDELGERSARCHITVTPSTNDRNVAPRSSRFDSPNGRLRLTAQRRCPDTHGADKPHWPLPLTRCGKHPNLAGVLSTPAHRTRTRRPRPSRSTDR
jgi:hypothetical protein